MITISIFIALAIFIKRLSVISIIRENKFHTASYEDENDLSTFLLNTSSWLGIAIVLQYFSLLGYYRYTPALNGTSVVLYSAFFKIQKIIVAAAPFIIGLSFFGLFVIGTTSSHFGNLRRVLVSLFSVMNCDSVWEVFNSVNNSNISSFLGTFYVLTIFIILSYLTLRLILALVESIYFYYRLHVSSNNKRKIFRQKILDLKDQNNLARNKSKFLFDFCFMICLHYI